MKMKKFREFLKGDAGLTNGDAIKILINTGILLGTNLYLYVKWMKAEEAKLDYELKMLMDDVNSKTENLLKRKNNSNSEEIADEFDF